MSTALQHLFDTPARIVDQHGKPVRLGASVRRVLRALALYIRATGTPAHRTSAWPAVNTLAASAGVSSATVRRALDHAEHLGILLSTPQFWTESRRGHKREQAPNRHTFHPDVLRAASGQRGLENVLVVPNQKLAWDTLDRFAIKGKTHYIDRRHSQESEVETPEKVTGATRIAIAGAASSEPPLQNKRGIREGHTPHKEQGTAAGVTGTVALAALKHAEEKSQAKDRLRGPAALRCAGASGPGHRVGIAVSTAMPTSTASGPAKVNLETGIEEMCK